MSRVFYILHQRSAVDAAALASRTRAIVAALGASEVVPVLASDDDVATTASLHRQALSGAFDWLVWSSPSLPRLPRLSVGSARRAVDLAGWLPHARRVSREVASLVEDFDAVILSSDAEAAVFHALRSVLRLPPVAVFTAATADDAPPPAAPVRELEWPERPACANAMPAVTRGAKPRVLAYLSNPGRLGAIRGTEPLETLKELGRISDFHVIDGSDPKQTSNTDDFDVVLVQRYTSAARAAALREVGGFVYDIDDNLLARRTYQSSGFGDRGDIMASLRDCSILTTTNLRLLHLLERASGIPLQQKAAIAPNAVRFEFFPLREAQRPRGILHVSSDRAPLFGSQRSGVVQAIEDFALDQDLPVFVLGRSDDLFKRVPVRLLGTKSYLEYLSFLARQPTCIAVAPMQTIEARDVMDFIDGKSDVKKVEFGGFHHVGIYSSSTCYLDSDLPGGVLAGNSYNEWYDAMQRAHDALWQDAAAHSREVRRARNMTVIATECWAPAIEAAILPHPVTIQQLDRLTASIGGAIARFSRIGRHEIVETTGKAASAQASLRAIRDETDVAIAKAQSAIARFNIASKAGAGV